MSSFGKSMRNRLPALGLGLISAFGMAAVGSVAFAPAAVAQKATAEFGKPMNEAKDFMAAGKWAEASAKVEQAAPFAKAPEHKLAVERYRLAIAANTKNTTAVIKSLETLNGMGIPADEIKKNKETLAGLYEQAGNKTKAIQLTKEYVDQYGGSPTQYAYLASTALGSKDYAGAINYGQKAIEAKRKAGAKPDEKWHNIVMKAEFEKAQAAGDKKMDGYYNALKKAAADYPDREQYWRDLTLRVAKEPKFSRTNSMVDAFRAMEAAGVTLKNEEKKEWAESALNRGQAAEAAAVFKPLIDSGAVGGASDPTAERTKKLYARMQSDAAADKAGGLDKEAAEPNLKPETLASIGEAWIGQGNPAKAVEVIQAAITKGASLDANTLASMKLHLGYAQYKAGQKDAARKTWDEIKSDNGAEVLADTWILISKR